MAKNSARASYINLNRPVIVLEGFFSFVLYTVLYKTTEPIYQNSKCYKPVLQECKNMMEAKKPVPENFF